MKMPEIVGDLINQCYEALLDLRSIFPAWSDTQANFYFHWTQILDSTTKFKDSENNTLKFYAKCLDPLIISNGEGITSVSALALVKQLDEHRKSIDQHFVNYNLEQILNRDTSSIKPASNSAQQTSKKSAAKGNNRISKQQPITDTTIGQPGEHVYGTRTKTKRLESSKAGKLDYNVAAMGTHLNKGFFSNYVWDFMVPTDEAVSFL